MSEEKSTAQEGEALNLSIILTQPPSGSPPEVLAGVTTTCDLLNLHHTGEPLTDPLTVQEREDLRWYLEEYWKWPYQEFATRGRQVEVLLSKVGNRLYQALFGGTGAQTLLEQWQKQPNVLHQISIVSDIPRVLSLPWELLHDKQDFLVLQPNYPISIVRRLLQTEQPVHSTPFKPPLRILLVTSRPKDAGFIDPRSIARELVDEVQTQVNSGVIEIEFLRPPTFSALQARLRDNTRPIHVLHFDGHGVFDEERKKQGILIFESESGKASLVRAGDLAKILQDREIRLVVLTACQSAVGSTDDVFSSVAAQMIRSGVDSVVAMSGSILVSSATRYAETFYRALAAGIPVPRAQEQARYALYNDPLRHTHRRHQREEGVPVELHDWWVPHFYQQNPVFLQPTESRLSNAQSQKGLTAARLSKNMPPEPRYGFNGRSYELFEIERALQRRKLVIIHGFSGVGKTALARESADWLTRTKMFAGACFVSFEHGGSAMLLLSAIGRYLGVNNENYNPNDQIAALAQLRPALKEQRTLVIADKLEDILPGGETSLDSLMLKQLWDVIFQLSAMSVGIILISQYARFGDERLAEGGKVMHLELKGLFPEDAHTFARRIFNGLGIDHASIPYAELHDLLAQLDHHPLAIELVLPSLREFPLSRVQADFTSLLPQFVDDSVQGRNKSLKASLDYSLRRLGEEQRALLPLLTPFEGGASEALLLRITEIPEEEWAVLRRQLEQAGLVTVEQFYETGHVLFIHFHPVLAPYLRARFNTEDKALYRRYALNYFSLASYLYDVDIHNPHAARTNAWWELPNLRRALELLLEVEGSEVTARSMEEKLNRILGWFGRNWEQDALHRRVDEALAVASARSKDALTIPEVMHETDVGLDELNKGNVHSAYARFSSLLKRIENLPRDIDLGRESYAHCRMLAHLAQCLLLLGQPASAADRLQEALSIVDTLIRLQPWRQVFIQARGGILSELAHALTDLEQYPQARKANEESLQVALRQGDLRSQALILGNLGTLALKLRDYDEARLRYTSALKAFRTLGEPDNEALTWHQMGRLAEEQEEWIDAERCYRESLAIREQFGEEGDAVGTCNRLAAVAANVGRFSEAEGWLKRGLELDERVHPGSPEHALHLNNFADHIVLEVINDRAPITRLSEARSYAEQALAIRENLDTPVQIWMPFRTFANIAYLEGQAEVARNYRRRERETFAAFAENRYQMDRQYGYSIVLIAAAARGDVHARAKVETNLQLEANGRHIADAIQRILAGERDWHSLAEDLDNQQALLILRVIETIAYLSGMQPKTPEQVIASLPTTIYEALGRGDGPALEQALEALSPEEQLMAREALQALSTKEEARKEEQSDVGSTDVLQEFEPLLQAIASVAVGDSDQQSEIESVLDDLEKEGWHLKERVKRTWAGERNAAILMEEVDQPEVVLVQRMLEIIAEEEGEIDPKLLLDKFARADKAKRYRLLTQRPKVLLNKSVESMLDTLLETNRENHMVLVFEEVRTLLRRCRLCGIGPVWYLVGSMHLGDNIYIPTEFESAVLDIATLLFHQKEDGTALERAVEALQMLLNRLTADVPDLFKAALLYDLADAMRQLPGSHIARKLDQIETSYSESLLYYQTADRIFDVAFIQYFLGCTLCEQGRYEEALNPFQDATQVLRTNEQYNNVTVWALTLYADTLDKIGLAPAALSTYTSAIRMASDATLATLYRNRAQALIHSRSFGIGLDLAEADLAHAVDLDGNENSPYLWYRRAQVAIARGEGLLADRILDEVVIRDASFDVAFLRVQTAWLQGDTNTAQQILQKEWQKANPGDRAVMYREMERLFDEHLELTGKDELQSVMLK